ncbi:MAG: hypothetical protein AAF663_05905 [Planctomycetota bacterium]
MSVIVEQEMSTLQLARVIRRPERTVRYWCETGFLEEARRDHPRAPWLIPLAYAASFFAAKFTAEDLKHDWNAERTERFVRRCSVRQPRQESSQLTLPLGR